MLNPLYVAIIYIVWFCSMYFVVLVLLLLSLGIPLFENKTFKKKFRPLVSVLVPAFNEEKKIAKTIASLKKVTYPLIEFIILNDGSTDKTSKIIKAKISGLSKFRFIDNKKNKGKAGVLNQGIALAKGEFVACMDADSQIEPEIFEKTLPYFAEKNVGAVTVSVRVKDPKTFLEKMIEIEYYIGLSLFLKVFSALNSVFVTPGPFSLYKKSMLKKIGGFDPKNIVEDHEIAYRIHKAGYKIKTCMDASVWTILPETFKKIYIQRRRWYSGAVETLLQHKKMWFKPAYGFFGFFAPLNQILIFVGLLFFFYTSFLGVANLIENVSYFQYVQWDVLGRLKDYSFDMLNLQKTTLFAWSSLCATIVFLFAGLKCSRIDWKTKKLGVFGYMFMFFLYQLFWIGSYWAVLRRKQVKWR